MQLLFLDESGQITPKDKNHSKYFVIGGVSISENHWHELYKDLNEIKNKYEITSEIKWRYFSPHNNEDINGLKHLTFEQKNEVRDKIYELIVNYPSIKIFSRIIDIKEAYELPNINDPDDLYWYGYKAVIEKFQDHLQNLSEESGLNINGVVIIDNRLPCNDDKLRNLHSKLDKEVQFKNLIEGLYIAPSHLSIGIQLADMVTGAIYRCYEQNDNKYFRQIQKSIADKIAKQTVDIMGKMTMDKTFKKLEQILFPKK